MNKKIVILGAGLSGLLVAYKLRGTGFDIEIIEARDRIGGRIHTIESKSAMVEMGATWFNEGHHNLKALLDELELPFFEQFMKGVSYYEPNEGNLQQINIPEDSPIYRIAGGTNQLIKGLLERISQVPVHLKQVVTQLDFSNDKIEIHRGKKKFQADYVISTLPPALFVTTIQTEPAFPSELIEISQNTNTWMQDSIKVAFVYESPFWRNKNYSGAFFSNVGPIMEFYDQTDENLKRFALCGFVHPDMKKYNQNERLEKIKSHLATVFGKEALDFTTYHERVWSEEIHTKSKTQNQFSYRHQNNGHPLFRKPYFESRFYFAGTETAKVFPGYMEGAVIAATNTVEALLKL